MATLDDWLQAVKENRTDDAEQAMAEFAGELVKAFELMGEAIKDWLGAVSGALIPLIQAAWVTLKPILDAWEAECWQVYKVAGSPYGPETAAMWRWTRERYEERVRLAQVQAQLEREEMLADIRRQGQAIRAKKAG